MEIGCPDPLISLNNGVQPNAAAKRSERSRKISNLDELIRSTPDVREDKVEKLRKRIKGGTYNIKAEKIAEKIIKGNPLDEIT